MFFTLKKKERKDLFIIAHITFGALFLRVYQHIDPINRIIRATEQ